MIISGVINNSFTNRSLGVEISLTQKLATVSCLRTNYVRTRGEGQSARFLQLCLDQGRKGFLRKNNKSNY